MYAHPTNTLWKKNHTQMHAKRKNNTKHFIHMCQHPKCQKRRDEMDDVHRKRLNERYVGAKEEERKKK
jgi:hypothetical protein